MIYAIIAVTVVFLLVLSPMFSVFSGKLTGKRAKRRLTYNLCAFGAVMLAGLFMPALALAAPAETADAVTAAVGITDAAIKAIAAAAGPSEGVDSRSSGQWRRTPQPSVNR